MRFLAVAAVAPLVLALASAPAFAADLPLERVFESPSLNGPAPREPKFSPDGRFVTLLKNRAGDKDRYDLWAIDTATGAARMLVEFAEDRHRRTDLRGGEDAP